MNRYRLSAAMFACLGGLAACGPAPHQEGGSTLQGMSAGERQPPRDDAESADCGDLPDAARLQALLQKAPEQGQVGGLAGGRYQWAAVVSRKGVLCAVASSVDDVTAVWPGSLAVSKAKAFTANAYSSDEQPLSTARLYTLSQPGHSLWGIAAANPFNPECLVKPGDTGDTGKLCGGTIAFGGGLALYRGDTKVGGLGVSGDTACADHEIAKRLRELAGLSPPKGAGADDIVYAAADGPSIYAHPLCIETWRNGRRIGDEKPDASG